jgi:hypothetical protein
MDTTIIRNVQSFQIREVRARTKIVFLVFAVGLLLICAGCATDTVADQERKRAHAQLFIQSHMQEILEIKRNAEKAFGPDQSKWTDAQKDAYIGALLALIRKYQPSSPPRPTVVVQQQASPHNPYIASGGVPPETLLHTNTRHDYGGTTTFTPNPLTGTGMITFPDGSHATVTRNPLTGDVSMQQY